ncbi:MAG TPA: hypothetical protein VFE47_27935 [Tepidisphaeraceae bacterium]|jgi:hypothetical protein|nr:hypothetical protein [Tepidisphaeraceae bacterium]
MMTSRGGTSEPAILGIVYVVMAILYFIPAMLLNRFASRIAMLMRSKRMIDVEAALAAQKSFWRFIGIMLIVVLGFYLVAAVCMVAFAAMR